MKKFLSDNKKLLSGLILLIAAVSLLFTFSGCIKGKCKAKIDT